MVFDRPWVCLADLRDPLSLLTDISSQYAKDGSPDTRYETFVVPSRCHRLTYELM